MPVLQSTTKILPELSNLLPFLSAWGALMLSEGAGLPEWLVVRRVAAYNWLQIPQIVISRTLVCRKNIRRHSCQQDNPYA